jgi:dihydrofolate reductase
VLSSKNLEIPKNLPDSVSTLSGTPGAIVQQLSKKGYRHLYIDGGKTIQGFLRKRLIQTLIITKIPILIGSGIPLFGELPQDIKLRLLETCQFDNGIVQSKYEVLEKDK